jgi:hypothetical protein
MEAFVRSDGITSMADARRCQLRQSSRLKSTCPPISQALVEHKKQRYVLEAIPGVSGGQSAARSKHSLALSSQYLGPYKNAN